MALADWVCPLVLQRGPLLCANYYKLYFVLHLCEMIADTVHCAQHIPLVPNYLLLILSVVMPTCVLTLLCEAGRT